jgi:hypothetical protein
MLIINNPLSTMGPDRRMCNPAIERIRVDLGKDWSVSTERYRHLFGRSTLGERERLLWDLSLRHGRLGLNMQVSVPKR